LSAIRPLVSKWLTMTQLAVSNIRASTHFLLHSIGPQAARRALAETAAALEEGIKFANSNSEWLS
jgi:hypothetical protein